MFNKYRAFIIQKLDEGYMLKEVFNMIDHESGFYNYDSFYSYVNNVLHYKRIKADCEHCGQVLWVYSPTACKEKPVCLAKKKIMRTDFKDKPFKCQYYKAEQERV